jgi:hypothetical protein
MFGSVYSSLTVDRIDVTGLWLTSGVVLIGYTFLITLLLMAQKKKINLYDIESFENS